MTTVTPPTEDELVREYDGSPSNIIRIGTRMAVEMIVNKFLELRGLTGDPT